MMFDRYEMLEMILAISAKGVIRSLGFIVLPVAIVAWFIGWLKDKLW